MLFLFLIILKTVLNQNLFLKNYVFLLLILKNVLYIVLCF